MGILNLLIDYLNELNKIKNKFNLFINIENDLISTMFVIDDNDVEIEKQIHLSSAKILINYYNGNYKIENMIFEKSENFEIPVNFISIKKLCIYK